MLVPEADELIGGLREAAIPTGLVLVAAVEVELTVAVLAPLADRVWEVLSEEVGLETERVAEGFRVVGTKPADGFR